MVPLLSLGIPGDPATAIILGGLLIHGLSPGPMLFIENAPQVYSIYLAILVAYIIVFIFQVNFIKHIVKILKVKPVMCLRHYLLKVGNSIFGGPTTTTALS